MLKTAVSGPDQTFFLHDPVCPFPNKGEIGLLFRNFIKVGECQHGRGRIYVFFDDPLLHASVIPFRQEREQLRLPAHLIIPVKAEEPHPLRPFPTVDVNQADRIFLLHSIIFQYHHLVRYKIQLFFHNLLLNHDRIPPELICPPRPADSHRPFLRLLSEGNPGRSGTPFPSHLLPQSPPRLSGSPFS